jgi:hypothetical protein
MSTLGINRLARLIITVIVHTYTTLLPYKFFCITVHTCIAGIQAQKTDGQICFPEPTRGIGNLPGEGKKEKSTSKNISPLDKNATKIQIHVQQWNYMALL